MWVDESPIQYQNWAPGFPGDAGGNKDCGVMNYNAYHGMWLLVECDNREYAICKMPMSRFIRQYCCYIFNVTLLIHKLITIMKLSYFT